MLSAYAIRLEMQKRGWISHDRISWMGWGDADKVFGYHIWFERWNWHGKRIDRCCYHASTDDLSKIDETVLAAAKIAKQAWRKFREYPPFQGADHKLHAQAKPGSLA